MLNSIRIFCKEYESTLTVISTILALAISVYGCVQSNKANETALEANEHSSEANKIASEANNYSREANKIASEANSYSQKANELAEENNRIARQQFQSFFSVIIIYKLKKKTCPQHPLLGAHAEQDMYPKTPFWVHLRELLLTLQAENSL